MKFDLAFEQLINSHLKKRKGERHRRLKEGLGHGEKLFLEKVWWPAFGHFNYLHPEYEIQDFKDGYRFIDFAYIRRPFRVAFEIDGYSTHCRDLSRRQFADHLLRQNHLILDGWDVMRFSYDDIKEKPRMCQQMLQQWMGRWFGDETNLGDLNPLEKELMRLALRLGRSITPTDAREQLGIGRDKSRVLLKNLVEKGWLQPAGGQYRVRSYTPNLKGKKLLW
ncbi:hypothetical protein [Effusibacillus lacus]|uniref:DNA-binding response regulator n=1 Tax=Effusibacillus lacus TaxID=1348429 RepID=A0A292YCZ4_9BACL|nr:hypothetical protein [Effusibacillus lacus]TCS71800.1 hypothetical protein EDD64_12415 [Effusibacillus lacus]GAX89632.1 hypothetical protein EFBL_1256 [Effusibacillus lacus]